jgi:hypothetical protein
MLTLIRRDNEDLNITITDKNGTAMSLVDKTVFFTVKKNIDDTDEDAVIVKEITNHTNAIGGVTKVTLDHDDTNIEARTYYWDLQIVDINGDTLSIPAQTLEITQDITIRTAPLEEEV